MKEAIQILFKEYNQVAGRVFADFYLRNNADSETQKTIEAGDFMLAMMTGKNIREKWELGKSEDFILLGKIAQAINKLSKD